ncbi:MAG: hypothetical protein H0T61_06890 [Actinobacteria bacterium]|nr:hypothetical protein [Actinomycetota bacterium]
MGDPRLYIGRRGGGHPRGRARRARGRDNDPWAWLRRHHERAYSFVDATSFALMRSLPIREALASDGDFAAAGSVELRA